MRLQRHLTLLRLERTVKSSQFDDGSDFDKDRERQDDDVLTQTSFEIHGREQTMCTFSSKRVWNVIVVSLQADSLQAANANFQNKNPRTVLIPQYFGETRFTTFSRRVDSLLRFLKLTTVDLEAVKSRCECERNE